jgi:hypothetical protein
MKKILVLLMSFLMFFSIGCQSSQQSQAPKNSFTLVLSKNKGKDIIFEKKIEIVDNKNLMAYLKDNAKVVESGGFIKSINDLQSIPTDKLTEEQKKAGIMGVDWFIAVNGKSASKGANDIYPQNGDNINVDYREWSPKDFENTK